MATQPLFTSETIEGLGLYFSIDAPNSVETLYSKVAPVRRAIDIRLNDLVSIPVEVEGAIPFDIKQVIRRMELDYLLYGAAYQLRVIRRGRWVGMQRLHPQTVIAEPLSTRGILALQFRQNAQEKMLGPWPESEMLYLWADSPRYLLAPGPAPFEAAHNAARALYIIERIAQSYFGNNGMPLTIIEVHGLSRPQKSKFERMVQRATSSILRAFSLIFTEGQVSTHMIAPKLADLSLDLLAREARRAIALAFNVPPSELEYDAVNYATAKQYRKTYLERTIAARAAIYEETLNRFLAPYKAQVRFDVSALASFQEDEANRAQALLSLTTAGFTAYDAARILGFDLPEDIANRYALLGSEPEMTEPNEQPGQPAEAKTAELGEPVKSQLQEELRRWQSKALKRYKRKGDFAVSFKSDIIPPTLAYAISTALAEAETPDEVKAIFKSARLVHTD